MKTLIQTLFLCSALAISGCLTLPDRTYSDVKRQEYVVVKREFVILVKAEIGWPIYKYPISAGRYRSFKEDKDGTYYYPINATDDGKINRKGGLYLLKDGSGGSTYFLGGDLVLMPAGSTFVLTGRLGDLPIPLGKIAVDDLKQIEKEKTNSGDSSAPERGLR